MLLRWSPSGDYLLCLELYKGDKTIAKLFEYFPSSGQLKQLKISLPPLDPNLQTLNSWWAPQRLMLVPKQEHLLLEKTLHMYSIDKHLNCCFIVKCYAVLKDWINIGLMCITEGAKSLFVVDTCMEKRHNYHSNIIQLRRTGSSLNFTPFKIYQLNGHIVDLQVEFQTSQLFFFIRSDRFVGFELLNERTVIHRLAKDFKACSFKNPFSNKGETTPTYTVLMGIIEDGEAEISSSCSNVHLCGYNEEPHNNRNTSNVNVARMYQTLIHEPCIVSVCQHIVVFQNCTFLRNLCIAFKHPQQMHLYVRHPFKPLYISKSTKSTNSCIEICVLPTANYEFKTNYGKNKSLDYSRPKRIKLRE